MGVAAGGPDESIVGTLAAQTVWRAECGGGGSGGGGAGANGRGDGDGGGGGYGGGAGGKCEDGR